MALLQLRAQWVATFVTLSNLAFRAADKAVALWTRVSPAHRLRQIALSHLGDGRPDLAFAEAGAAIGQTCTGISVADDLRGPYSIRVMLEGGGFRIGLARDYLYWPFLNERLLALRPYLDRFARDAAVGAVQISLGDLGDGPDRQICFSSDDPDHLLIPDPMFLESNGYNTVRREARGATAGFEERRPVAYWRGGLTGMADTFETIMQLPRVQLCLLAKEHAAFDAKLTDLAQFGPWLPHLEWMLEGLDTLGPREPVSHNLLYRYLIDVDGNSNSWPGLFCKLLAGGLVLKVRSRFQQWYYPRLDAEPHVIWVDAIEDLPGAVDRALADPQGSAAIAAAGAAFARSLTPKSEYSAFADAMQRALAWG